MIDKYTYIIVALLPLSALMLVFQTNPYYALVIRAILGAIAALVYIVLGGADVALTEALVGTMLAVTLYVIAVRSSLVMRLGILKKDLETGRLGDEETNSCIELIASLRKVINKHYLRLELVEYPNLQALKTALIEQEVHGICTPQPSLELTSDKPNGIALQRTYQTTIRVRRLFEILQTELISPQTDLTFVTVTNAEEKH